MSKLHLETSETQILLVEANYGVGIPRSCRISGINNMSCSPNYGPHFGYELYYSTQYLQWDPNFGTPPYDCNSLRFLFRSWPAGLPLVLVAPLHLYVSSAAEQELSCYRAGGRANHQIEKNNHNETEPSISGGLLVPQELERRICSEPSLS